jgi:uncharacterized protein with PQ loop repeat
MPKRPHPQKTLQRRFIDKFIFVVATLQPLANVPQIIAIFSHKSAHDVSISSWAIFLFFDFLWLWYGLAEKQSVIIISAVLFAIFELLVLVGAILYGGTW